MFWYVDAVELYNILLYICGFSVIACIIAQMKISVLCVQGRIQDI